VKNYLKIPTITGLITLPHQSKNKIKYVKRKYQKIAEDGKEILTRKLKHLKIL
jgi:hypothetical protein